MSLWEQDSAIHSKDRIPLPFIYLFVIWGEGGSCSVSLVLYNPSYYPDHFIIITIAKHCDKMSIEDTDSWKQDFSGMYF